MSIELDSFLKERALGSLPARRWFVTAPLRSTANRHFMGYWAQEVPVVTDNTLCALLGVMSKWYFMKQDVSHYTLSLSGSHRMYPINAAWSPRPPVLCLRSEDEAHGREVLGRLGVPPDAWFVGFHAREPGYSPADEPIHAHRNGSPQALVPALSEIARRGGWCIRMGSPTGAPSPALPRVIDYARSPVRSERMDVFLCARARFFLGNTSGISFVSSTFGVPVAFANMIPMSTLGMLPRDISIVKLLRRRESPKPMRFDEVLGGPAGNFRFATLYDEAGIEVVENSPDEILELVREMLDRLDGTCRDADGDQELQERFMRLLQPRHYSYGAASRIGAAFLRKYQYLLPT
jgi:putative glycosyltransferase (TIGR04372 family)